MSETYLLNVAGVVLHREHVAPDGALHYVPFATLRHTEAGRKVFLIQDHDIAVTPLEASVGTRTPTAMQFLLSHGARMDRREQDVITCLATEDDANEILEYLDTTFPGAKPDCAHVTTPW